MGGGVGSVGVLVPDVTTRTLGSSHSYDDRSNRREIGQKPGNPMQATSPSSAAEDLRLADVGVVPVLDQMPTGSGSGRRVVVRPRGSDSAVASVPTDSSDAHDLVMGVAEAHPICLEEVARGEEKCLRSQILVKIGVREGDRGNRPSQTRQFDAAHAASTRPRRSTRPGSAGSVSSEP